MLKYQCLSIELTRCEVGKQLYLSSEWILNLIDPG